MCDDLLVWAKLADLYRHLSNTPANGVIPGSWCGRLPPALPAAVGWVLDAYRPVIEPPRLDARRILGRWLISRRTGERLQQSA